MDKIKKISIRKIYPLVPKIFELSLLRLSFSFNGTTLDSELGTDVVESGVAGGVARGGVVAG